MQDYRVEAEVSRDGSVTVKGLPFQPGDRVEVVIHGREPQDGKERIYSLRGRRIQYIDPFESVAEEDWNALK